jgi:hypothetical protein
MFAASFINLQPIRPDILSRSPDTFGEVFVFIMHGTVHERPYYGLAVVHLEAVIERA